MLPNTQTRSELTSFQHTTTCLSEPNPNTFYDELTNSLQSQQFSTKDVFAIQLALDEAITNAFKHGNRFDAGKRVWVRYRIHTQQAWFQVEDQGSGFQVNDVPDPTDIDFLERSNGRGVFLMHHYMDSVEYNDMGNIVTLTKQRSNT